MKLSSLKIPESVRGQFVLSDEELWAELKVMTGRYTDELFREAALRALTKADGEGRINAAKRALRDPIARNVKLADVADNMDMSRIPNPTEKDYARLREYETVRAILLGSQ